ncbi:hypothetical protein HWV62_43463 [Athelia sp. TMB]|nr:hypothetical protein HWV62_43463 [Athelia sp. TMB]
MVAPTMEGKSASWASQAPRHLTPNTSSTPQSTPTSSDAPSKHEQRTRHRRVPAPFSQIPGRDAHERKHEGKTLKCDACGYESFQDSEMTRHKQNKHGHGKGGKKIGHTKTESRKSHNVTRAASGAYAESPAAPPSLYFDSPEASCSSSAGSFDSPAYPALALSPSPALLSPGLFWSQIAPIFPESPQATDLIAIGSFPDLDSSSLLCPSGISFAENRSNEPEGLQALIASMPEVGFLSPLAVPFTSDWTPPLTWDSTSPDSDDIDLSHLSPEEWAIMLEEPEAQEIDQLPALDFWPLISSDSASFLSEPAIQFISEQTPLYNQSSLF